MENKFKKNDVINKYNILFLNLQFIITIIVIVFGVISFMKPNFDKWFQLSLGLDLITIGYNNYLIYRRKKFTFIYISIGILLLFLSIFSFMGI